MSTTPRPIDIVNMLVNWYDENDGMTGPHAGALFNDNGLTWNDAVHDAVNAYDDLVEQKEEMRKVIKNVSDMAHVILRDAGHLKLALVDICECAEAALARAGNGE